MTYPTYIREKAIAMRVERDLTIDEISERLAIPRGTIYSWVNHIPLPEYSTKPRKLAQIRATEATVAKWQKARDDAYAQGVEEWATLAGLPTFREFVALYIAEGYKRSRNKVSVSNSDPTVMAVCVAWLRRLTDRQLSYSLQFHADQDLDELRRFWGAELGFDGEQIKFQRKSNSNQLAGRTWRSVHGVLAVGANDTMLRARLQAYMDLIRLGWTLNSAPARGV